MKQSGLAWRRRTISSFKGSRIFAALTACAFALSCDSDPPTSSDQDSPIRPLEKISTSGPPVITSVTGSSVAAGARIVAGSSNFGAAADDERWGAGSAIDESPGTAWSSAGDGDGAFIEIELAGPARLHAIEVWTRSMSNDTAQIFSFTLTTDGNETLGPFELADASQAYRFEIDTVASSLRLDVASSNGGNTGLVEFAAFGTLLDE